MNTQREMETVIHMNTFPLLEEESGEGVTTEELEISSSNRRGKILTRKRKVRSIDSALDPDNCN